MMIGSDASDIHRDVARLAEILTLPADGGDDCDWELIATRTGWWFPTDYRDFMRVYGMGDIPGWVGINAPPLRGVPLEALDGLWPSGTPHPAEDGLFGWGGSGGGDTFRWRCADPDPDAWTISVKSRHDVFEYDMGMARFLNELLHGRLAPDVGIKPQIRYRWLGWRENEREMIKEYPDYEGRPRPL